jgi:hypothetical protein
MVRQRVDKAISALILYLDTPNGFDLEVVPAGGAEAAALQRGTTSQEKSDSLMNPFQQAIGSILLHAQWKEQ